MAVSRSSRCADIASAVSRVLHFDSEDQASPLDVIQDCFTSDADADDSDADSDDGQENEVYQSELVF